MKMALSASSSILPSLLISLAILSASNCSAKLVHNLLGDLANNLRNAANHVSDQIQIAVGIADSQAIQELGQLSKEIAKQISLQCSNITNATTTDNVIRLHNWGGTFRYSTQNIQYPRTTAEVQQIVGNANKLRVIGSRHSFNRIGDSPDTILSTLGMNSVLGFDGTKPSVTVQAGMTYADFCPFLHAVGFALPNLAALTEISIGGAISVGVHGSGLAHQNLPSQMLSLRLVLANGSVASYQRGDPEWPALAVGFGAFGVVTEVELLIVPRYNVITYVFLNMPMSNLFANFNTVMSLGYTVQLFSAMSNSSVMDQVWVTVRPDQDVNGVANMSNLFGATRAPGQVTPIAALPGTYLVDQEVEHPWYEGLTDYGVGLSGNDGNEIQTEFLIPYEYAVPALQAVNNLSDTISPLVYVWFMRTIKSDQFWMSQCSGGDSHLAIHFTWQPNMTAVVEVGLPLVNQALRPYQVRPHWGKLFTLDPQEFLPTYPNLGNFTRLAQRFDPNGKFRNDFLNTNVFCPCPSCQG